MYKTIDEKETLSHYLLQAKMTNEPTQKNENRQTDNEKKMDCFLF